MMIQTQNGTKIELPDGSTPEHIDDVITHLQAAQAQQQPASDNRFLADKSGFTYGDILPFKKNEVTGETSLALPEMIRSPVRGIQDLQTLAENKSTDTTQDAVNAMVTMATPFAGEGYGAAGKSLVKDTF